MRECMIYHTGVYECAKGIIKDNIVYIYGQNDEVLYPEEMFMAREECEDNLIQFEVEGKWGFADIYSGEIKIHPRWDFAAPFYSGYAHVSSGSINYKSGNANFDVKGGKHGFINISGQLIIPLEYDDAVTIPYRGNFIVCKDNMWGIVNVDNKELIPITYDYLCTSYDNKFVAYGIKEFENITDSIKWGVYNKDFELVVKPELDKKPYENKLITKTAVTWPEPKKYYTLEKKEKYGVLCEDGRLITDITLTKNEAENIINAFIK